MASPSSFIFLIFLLGGYIHCHCSHSHTLYAYTQKKGFLGRIRRNKTQYIAESECIHGMLLKPICGQPAGSFGLFGAVQGSSPYLCTHVGVYKCTCAWPY